MSGTSRVNWVDTAKGISILLVTLLHCTVLTGDVGIHVEQLDRLNHNLGPIRMPLFFLASGVFAGSAIAASWPILLRRRVWFFAWLLFAWTVVRFLWVAYILPNPTKPHEGKDWTEIFWTMVMPQTGIWFLWALGMFYIAAKLLSYVDKRGAIIIAVTISILSTGYLPSGDMPVTDEVLGNLAYRFKFFAFFFVAALYPTLVLALARIPLVRSVPITLGALALSIFLKTVSHHPVTDGIAGVAVSASGVVVLLLISHALTPVRWVGDLLSTLGQNTLPIYVAQVPIISLFAYLAVKVAPALGWFENFIPIVMVPLVVATTLLLRLGLQAIGAYWMYDLPKRWQYRKPAPASEVQPVAATSPI